DDLTATNWLGVPMNPTGLAIDADGNMYMSEIDDQGNEVFVRHPDGTTVRYAGNGGNGYNGDNIPALDAEFEDPIGLALDATGNPYMGDEFNGRVRKVDHTTGIITTIAGASQGDVGGMGGPAGDATLGNPVGLAFGPNGDLFIASRNNDVVLRVAATNGVV